MTAESSAPNRTRIPSPLRLGNTAEERPESMSEFSDRKCYAQIHGVPQKPTRRPSPIRRSKEPFCKLRLSMCPTYWNDRRALTSVRIGFYSSNGGGV